MNSRTLAAQEPGTLHRFLLFLNTPSGLKNRSDVYLRNMLAILHWVSRHPERSTNTPTAEMFVRGKVMVTKSMKGVYIDVTFQRPHRPVNEKGRLLINLVKTREMIDAAWEYVDLREDEKHMKPKLNVVPQQVKKTVREDYEATFVTDDESNEEEEEEEEIE